MSDTLLIDYDNITTDNSTISSEKTIIKYEEEEELELIPIKEIERQPKEHFELVTKDFFDKKMIQNLELENKIWKDVDEIRLREIKEKFNKGFNPNAFNGRFFKMLLFKPSAPGILINLIPYMDDNTKGEFLRLPIDYNINYKNPNFFIENIKLLIERKMINEIYTKQILIDYVKDKRVLGYHNYINIKNSIESGIENKKIIINYDDYETFIIRILYELTENHCKCLLTKKVGENIMNSFYELVEFLSSRIPQGYFSENKDIKNKYKLLIEESRKQNNNILEEALRQNDYSESYFTFFE